MTQHEPDTLQAEAGGGGKRIRPVEVTLGDDPDRRRRNRRLHDAIQLQLRMAQRIEISREAARYEAELLRLTNKR